MVLDPQNRKNTEQDIVPDLLGGESQDPLLDRIPNNTARVNSVFSRAPLQHATNEVSDEFNPPIGKPNIVTPQELQEAAKLELQPQSAPVGDMTPNRYQPESTQGLRSQPNTTEELVEGFMSRGFRRASTGSEFSQNKTSDSTHELSDVAQPNKIENPDNHASTIEAQPKQEADIDNKGAGAPEHNHKIEQSSHDDFSTAEETLDEVMADPNRISRLASDDAFLWAIESEQRENEKVALQAQDLET